jgi:XTP/dITP diphosphohydrolase
MSVLSKKVVIASSNKDKIQEIKEILNDFEVIAFSDIIPKFEIQETGTTFKENAIIKAKTVYEKLKKEYIVLSDDSGICVDALGGKPGIYSARFAGDNADDKKNLQKLIQELKNKNITTSSANYTCAVAIVNQGKISTVHGWMYGKVTTTPQGENGFGYDPIFIPNGFNKTIAQLDSQVKHRISHRFKAFDLAKFCLSRVFS